MAVSRLAAVMTFSGPFFKQPKAAKDPAYLARVRELPCCICEAFGEVQMSPTAAHHVICGRYSTGKTPDLMAIPLCEGHHQGLRDTSKLAIHQGKEAWVLEYGPDTDWIAPTQDKLSWALPKDRSEWPCWPVEEDEAPGEPFDANDENSPMGII